MLHGVANLLSGTRGCAVGPSVALLRSPFYCFVRFLFFVVVPVVQILRLTGHNPVWCLLALVPGLNFLAFWFLAFKPWPKDKKPATTAN
jgi:hypothetical protein